MLVPFASVSSQIADYVSALLIVYVIMLLAYLLTNMIFSFGVRAPYAMWSEAVLHFLRDVSEPYLRVFRRFIPPIGPVDLSPMVAIFLLLFLDEVIRKILNA